VDVRVSEGEYSVAGVNVNAVPLFGHTGAHFGYAVGGALFTGDALAGEQEMAQARISYAYSFTKQLDSLRQLAEYDRARRYDWYILAHDTPRRQIGDLVAQNIARIEEMLQFIVGFLTDRPAEAGDVLSAVCRRFDLRMRHVRDYFLLYPALHSCLSHLHNTGRIQYMLQDSRLLWKVEA
jgi:glyoxylase-like metal-dependent hydrolase (beta-lactamase superfamily II)